MDKSLTYKNISQNAIKYYYTRGNYGIFNSNTNTSLLAPGGVRAAVKFSMLIASNDRKVAI